MSHSSCPCHSGLDFETCCGRFISQQQQPENAEQLMRSRYTAYVLGDSAYLMSTWHQSTRPSSLNLQNGPKWIGLQILNTATSANSEARVEFEARFLAADRVDAMHEKSRFLQEHDLWFYVDGEMLPTTFKPWKPGRNEACPCGSGLKFKRCCG